MKTKILAAIFALLVASLISGCNNPPPVADDGNATTNGISAVVDGNNQFAFDYYNQIKVGEGNIFFSPWSISSALSMTYEGARGNTADEMQKVLHFPKEDNVRRPNFAAIYNEINKGVKDYQLNTANALWAEQQYTFLPEYLSLVEKYYGGKTTNMDFRTQPEKSRQIINSWVEDQTKDKIKELIPPGIIDGSTRLVLTNAVYFKGEWVDKFDKKNTKEENFIVTPDVRVPVQMMSLTGERFNYAETDTLQVLEMPHKGNELSMLVLLPKSNDIESVELNLGNLALWRNSLKNERVNVFMPKFKLETMYMMADDLIKMGMPTAFGAADFSGMDGTKNLYIGAVIHKAYVDVYEEGTEAAAATAVVMKETAIGPSPEPKTFRADHPFIFIIQEKETGNILFMGRVLNPFVGK